MLADVDAKVWRRSGLFSSRSLCSCIERRENREEKEKRGEEKRSESSRYKGYDNTHSMHSNTRWKAMTRQETSRRGGREVETATDADHCSTLRSDHAVFSRNQRRRSCSFSNLPFFSLHQLHPIPHFHPPSALIMSCQSIITAAESAHF